PYRLGRPGRRQAPRPRDPGRGFEREALEVRRRHRAVSATEVERSPYLRVLHGLRVHAAGGRIEIAHRLDGWDGGQQHRQLAAADVAPATTAVPVAGRVDLGVLLRHRAVLLDAAVPAGDAGAEADLTDGAVPGEHAVLRAGVGEVGDLGPEHGLGFALRFAAGRYDPD